MSANSPIRKWIVPGLLLLLAAGLAGLALLLPGRTPRLSRTMVSEPGAETKPEQRKAAAQQVLTGAGAASLAQARSDAGHRSLEQVLAYGSGEAALGMVRVREQEPVGPESFAVARNGNILVADVAKQRLAVYSREGEYLRSIALPGIALGDVTTDSRGGIYVYDQVTHTLYQYDADGTQRGSLNLNPKDLNTRGYFHVVGNAVYFADAAARDVLVATVQDEKLVSATQATERTTDGIHAESGRVYSLALERGQALRVTVGGADAGAARTIEVPWPGVVSARYAGEDESGRFYVQTERTDGDRIALEVLMFNAAGGLLSATPLPENDYAIWTAKLVDVRGDGTIVQFLPQKDQARLNLFTN